MNELSSVLLETEPALPMEIAGWGVLLVGLVITVVWLLYLYR
ncbi:hypothetical protein [Natrononativus amylolyticus]|nr:hypothetical protein [Natrononativus amylolyticus]